MIKPYRGYNKQELIKSRGKDLTSEQYEALGKRNRDIADLKMRGWSWGKIARKYGLSREYVKKY